MTERIKFDYIKDICENQVDGLDILDLNDFVGSSWINESIDNLWFENYAKNKPRMDRFPKSKIGQQRACILVGSSPSILNQVDQLKRAWEDDRFLIITCNASLRFLLENHIIPDFVFSIEARDHIQTDFECDTKGLTMIAGPFLNPNVVEKWKGELYFYIFGGGEKYAEQLKNDWGEDIDISGGNVLSTAMCWAYRYLTCRDFIFIGMSLSFKDNYYFDSRSTENVSLDLNDYKKWLQAVDMNGNLVYTTPALCMYKTWIEGFTRKLGCNITNATEDGILAVYPEPVKQIDAENFQFKVRYIPWINIVPLKVAIDGYKAKFERR